MFRLTPIVKNLLLITVGIFLVDQYLTSQALTHIFSFYSFTSPHFEVYQLVTYMFLHGSISHILGNMFALAVFGPMLEDFWGAKKFLIFYLITGIGAGLFYAGINYYEVQQLKKDVITYMEHPDPDRFVAFMSKHDPVNNRLRYQFINHYSENPSNESYVRESREMVENIYQQSINSPMLGASGSIFGILMAFGMLFPNTVLMLLIPPIPIKAKYFVLIYGLLELYFVIQPKPGDNIAHFAHLGGMLFAFILIKAWGRGGNRRT